MKLRIRLFLWLSALLAGLGIFWVAENSFEIAVGLGWGEIKEAMKNDEIPRFTQLRWGLLTMGTILLLSSTLLFLLGKKLKTSRYVIYFMLGTLASIVIGSAVASL